MSCHMLIIVFKEFVTDELSKVFINYILKWQILC